ncbi:phospholipase D-like domain-containing protein [Klebsiella pneumoniae]|nr:MULTISPECIES: phospholipase D-like domain-containing protein [Klebsiella]MCL2986337.1 phospholipase D-like domain-containing protein [Klebsiella pneumoniae]MCL3144928.1 phospholipase D-like domain-containing protein [Klebsiella pneumoniae]MCM6135750.1 phospholipase D-like domain-containing protein [Klebsiella pneumoniae]MCQ0684017.1 phospholipase D-like domain-containing protein [Klebsiella pneumoniae]MCQ3990672.1 hypothetical protein [Klebsiella pneumoniae]
MNRTLRRCCLSGLISLSLFAPVPAVYAASIEAGFSPEGSALQLVLNTIVTAQQSIRLMGYSFTSPEVTRALIQAKQRGIDVRVLLDWKANSAKGSAGVAAMNLLANAGIPGVSLDIENYCTLRLFFDLSTFAGLSRRNLPEDGIRLLFQI